MVRRARSLVMASRAPRSRQKPIPVLVNKMASTTALSVYSPAMIDTTAAKARIRMSGLLTCS